MIDDASEPIIPIGPTLTPQLIRFGGYIKGANINARDGELILQVAVPLTEKWSALPATDHLGTVYDIELHPRVYDPDADEDNDKR